MNIWLKILESRLKENLNKSEKQSFFIFTIVETVTVHLQKENIERSWKVKPKTYFNNIVYNELYNIVYNEL